MLIPSIQKALHELSDLLAKLSHDDYTSPCYGLSGSTIGEHTRHIIEMFQCLDSQYDSETINYDLRKRDYAIQTDTLCAQKAIATILNQLDKSNKNLELQQTIEGEAISINTNYYRELVYNLEHCIHHQALIKVALLQLEHINIDDNFGVARSTIEYRKQCAQ
ncbi:DinB family protein [Flavobacterium sp.]|uniref:DinB family protein n=1 Tax=Flavobacterium sp. TaxID=239 RepID=UPI00286D2D15|nr:DinB family protein [Flavobacterium sp.]